MLVSPQLNWTSADANYSKEISKTNFFKKFILDYHKDAILFWKRYQIHHPFLLDNYPLDKRKGGIPYHRNFSKIGLGTEVAEIVSFVELLNVPTTGNLGNNKKQFFNLMNFKHLQWIDEICNNHSGKVIFIPRSVLRYMKTINKHDKLFDILNSGEQKNSLTYLYSHDQLKIIKSYHFSSASVHKELPLMRKVIDDILEKPTYK